MAPLVSRGGQTPKSEVHYRESTSEAERCETCIHFKTFKHGETGRCTIVKGRIHPDDVCDKWADLLDGG